jgi:septation ring formation regulator EzrA
VPEHGEGEPIWWVIGISAGLGAGIAAIIKATALFFTKKSERKVAEHISSVKEWMALAKHNHAREEQTRKELTVTIRALKDVQDREVECQRRLGQLEDSMEELKRSLIEEQNERVKTQEEFTELKKILVNRTPMLQEIHEMVSELKLASIPKQ